MIRSIGAAAVLLLITGTGSYGLPQTHADGASASRHLLLDVPYLAQTEDLCGGASLAMVLRYWGDASVEPAAFASLVDHSEGGIRTTALRQAAQDRGWLATTVPPARASLDAAQAEIDQGHPLIALIEVRPRVYHYVVIVGLTAAAVIVNDPAAAPYTVFSRADFERRWAPTSHWLLLVLPRSPHLPPAPPPATRSSDLGPNSVDISPCAALVDASVTVARAGQMAGAEQGLTAATTLCPEDASAWREMAGLRFVERQYATAVQLADRAVRLDPSDRDAWRLDASARYVTGDTFGALQAWNYARVPTIGDITVTGLRRTRVPVVIDRAGLATGRVLTTGDVRRAEHRLTDWGLGSAPAVRYDPVGAADTANVHLVVNERTIIPRTLGDLGGLAGRMIFLGELSADIVSPAHDGDIWTGTYRWTANRPSIGGALRIPAPGSLPGMLTLDGFAETQSYSPTNGDTVIVKQHQRHGAATLSDWATGRVKWQAAAGIDRFDDADFASVRAGVETRWLADRISVSADTTRWIAAGQTGTPFWDATLAADWRSTTTERSSLWTARGGFTGVSASAPLALWPIPSSSSARGELLRGHGLFDEDVIVNTLTGRRMVFATIEYQHVVWQPPFGRLAFAAFVDNARTWMRRLGGASPFETDIGVGARLSAAGAGAIRLDAGYGLRDGSTSLSGGYIIAFGS